MFLKKIFESVIFAGMYEVVLSSNGLFHLWVLQVFTYDKVIWNDGK